MPTMDRVFLDANILFSAAYRDGAGLQRLWRLTTAKLITSAYAVEEARRNLDTDEQRDRLTTLLTAVEIVPSATAIGPLAGLPGKDVPILAAAVQAKASHLLTGDVRHFGPLFGTTVEGVLIQPPALYLVGQLPGT